jgi:hypothetical protein
MTSDPLRGMFEKRPGLSRQQEDANDQLDTLGGVHNLIDALLEELENVEEGAIRAQALRDVRAALERACRIWVARLVEGLDGSETPEKRSAALGLAFEYLTAAAGL